KRTTATRIAARAGVTWGAVQHHYGDKDGILAAVLDDTFARFPARFDDVADPTVLPLEARVRPFTPRARRPLSRPHFRSTFEILLQALGSTGGTGEDPATEQRRRMLSSFDTLWRRVFPDVVLPRRQRIALERFTLATLIGLGLQSALGGARAPELRD